MALKPKLERWEHRFHAVLNWPQTLRLHASGGGIPPGSIMTEGPGGVGLLLQDGTTPIVIQGS